MQTIAPSDLALVRRLLNATYTVREGKQPNTIHCASRTGMRINGDADDDEQWAYVLAAFRRHLSERLVEVSENVCAWHSDFTIYLAAPTPTPIQETTQPPAEL